MKVFKPIRCPPCRTTRIELNLLRRSLCRCLAGCIDQLPDYPRRTVVGDEFDLFGVSDANLNVT